VTRYRCLVADPPWQYGDVLAMSDVKRSAGDHYSTMSVEAICNLAEQYPLRIAGHRLTGDAFLWLWVTNAFLLDGSGARVCKAWGFEPRQIVTWVKGRIGKEAFVPQIGMDHHTHRTTEHLILATRGTAKALVKDRGVPNVVIAPRSTHSTKPDAAFQLIERVSPGPYLEMFARRPRSNWTTWGDEAAA